MNKYSIFTLKALRKGYSKIFCVKQIKPICEHNPDVASQIIYDKLMADEPCMIARFGSSELFCICNYLGVKNAHKNLISYIRGNTLDWWWNDLVIRNMNINAGFFPPIIEKIEQYSKLMLNDISQIDVLGSWLNEEIMFKVALKDVLKIRLLLLDPYWSKISWTKALEGKRVLVVHPFAKTIESQYKKRQLLFANNLLPAFDLKTIKAVQSLAGEKTEFKDWFEALDYMKNEIDNQDYDICLIGAGAYGFPLAAHVKRKGKKAVHLGGSLQLLFGIKGKRWEDPNYNKTYNYSALMNEHWVNSSDAEKPQNAAVVEGACYW